jgi:hypothetical protein
VENNSPGTPLIGMEEVVLLYPKFVLRLEMDPLLLILLVVDSWKIR